MKATLLYGPHDIRFEDRPDPQITRPPIGAVSMPA